MSGQVSKILTVEDARFLLDSGLSPKKLEAQFEDQPEEVKAKVRALILSEKGKSPAQKLAEQMLQMVAARLDREFVVYRDEKRTPVPLRRVTANVVTESSIEGLVEIAADELKSNGITLGKSKVEEVVRTWEMNAKPINDLPKSFSLDPTELTFNFISLDIADGPCPTFDSFIARCGANGPALMAYIWSIFENAEIQQYVLMRGEGRDGKGSLLRLIEKLVGPKAYHGNSVKDEHWVAKLVGKRVAVWSDVNSTAFVMSDLFKQVTGGDRVTVTEKHKPSYSARLDFRTFIATNNEPELTSRNSDLRRILYVEVAEASHIPNYEESLLSEAAAILFKCRQKFAELYNTEKKEIICDMSMASDKAAEFEIEFSTILEKCFDLGPNYQELNETVFFEIREYFKFTSRYTQWKKWLNRQYGIKEVQEKVEGQKRPKKYLKGIKLKHKS